MRERSYQTRPQQKTICLSVCNDLPGFDVCVARTQPCYAVQASICDLCSSCLLCDAKNERSRHCVFLLLKTLTRSSRPPPSIAWKKKTMETYRRERTVSAFASSSAQQPGPPLPPPPPSNGAAALSHSGSALKNHAHEFRQRVKSDSARRPNLSSQLQQANLYLYNPREAVTGRPPLPPSQPPHKQNIPRARTRLQPQPSHETSQGFVSFNSFSLDNAGLPRPQPTAPQQTSRTPLKSSANASKSRPYALSGAPSVPQSLLEPLSIEPGYSIHKPEDTTNSQTYIQGNIKSIQTLASSLNRQTTISSDGARGHAQPEQNIATLSPQQCWYLLRTLVELEIEDECSKLWKLTGGLDADSVEWDSSIECLSEEQTTTEEFAPSFFSVLFDQS